MVCVCVWTQGRECRIWQRGGIVWRVSCLWTLNIEPTGRIKLSWGEVKGKYNEERFVLRGIEVIVPFCVGTANPDLNEEGRNEKRKSRKEVSLSWENKSPNTRVWNLNLETVQHRAAQHREEYRTVYCTLEPSSSSSCFSSLSASTLTQPHAPLQTKTSDEELSVSWLLLFICRIVNRYGFTQWKPWNCFHCEVGPSSKSKQSDHTPKTLVWRLS